VVALFGLDPIEELMVALVSEPPDMVLMTRVILVFMGRLNPPGISCNGLVLGASGEALLVLDAVEVSARVSP